MSSGVEFDEDSFAYGKPSVTAGGPQVPPQNVYQNNANQFGGVKGWIIRHGFAKDSHSADIFMIGLLIVNFVITFFVIKYFL